MNILCRFGFHKWLEWFIDTEDLSRGSYRECRRCGRKQKYRFYSNWTDGWADNPGDLSMTHKTDKPKTAEKCPMCGEYESHFVPPCLGKEGFFVCKPKPDKQINTPLKVNQDCESCALHEAMKQEVAKGVFDRIENAGFGIPLALTKQSQKDYQQLKKEFGL